MKRSPTAGSVHDHRLGVARAVSLDVGDGLGEVVDLADREDQIAVLGRPVGLAGGDDPGGRRAGLELGQERERGWIPAKLDARFHERAQAGERRCPSGAVPQQGLDAVAGRRVAGLGVDGDGRGLVRVRVRVQIQVAEPLGVAEHGDSWSPP